MKPRAAAKNPKTDNIIVVPDNRAKDILFHLQAGTGDSAKPERAELLARALEFAAEHPDAARELANKLREVAPGSGARFGFVEQPDGRGQSEVFITYQALKA